MQEHMKLLGHKVRDRVTRFEGVVSSISFDLYGCVQAIVTPKIGKDGKQPESAWFDTKRLEVLSSTRVMEPGTYEGSTPQTVAGGFHKPMPRGA
jgi:hypothetical protein